jgi:hypothetical protein
LRGLSLSLTLKHTKDNNPQNNKHRMMLILSSRNIHKGQCFFIRGGTRNENACALKGIRAEERGEGSSGDEHFDGRTGGEDTQVRGVKWAAGRWWQWIGKKMGAGGGVY